MDHSKSSDSSAVVDLNDSNNNNNNNNSGIFIRKTFPHNNNNNIRRRKIQTTFLSSEKTILVVTSSCLLFCLLLLPDVVAAGVDRDEVSRVEEDWLRSERDVRTIEKIISNLYGQENPFNLLVKHSVAGKRQQQRRTPLQQRQQEALPKFLEKMEKRFVKHAHAHEDSLDLSLLRPGSFELRFFFANL